MAGFLEVLRVINGAVHGVALVVKAAELVESGVAIHGLVTKKGLLTPEEKAQLAGEIAVATLKTLDFAATGACLVGGRTSYAPLFKNMRLVTSISNGMASISKASIRLYFKEEISENDILHVVGVIFFHVADASGAALEEPKFNATLHTGLEITNTISNLGGALIMSYSKRAKLQRGALVLANWASQLARSTPAQAHPAVERLPVMIPPSHVTNPIEAEEYYENEVDRVLVNKSRLTEIPTVMQHHPIFQKMICPITKKPVRTALSPFGHSTIVYERERIREILNAGEKPPQWPEGLDFTMANLTANHLAQHLIDSTLDEIAKEWSEARQNVDKEKRA